MAEAKEVSETRQELSLVCPADIVYCDPGDDAVLSFHLEPAISAVSMEIKWRNRADLVCHYKNRQLTESSGYEGRVSLSLQDLPKGKVSLTFRNVRTSQRGLYICEVIHEWQTLKEYIFLHVSSDFSLVVPSHTVSAYLGSDVILPIHLSPETSAVVMKINWYKGSELVYQCRFGQETHFQNRVGLSIQELRRGNLSLTLRNVQGSDSGDYTCKVFHDGCLQTGIIHLQVMEFQKRALDLEDLDNVMRLWSTHGKIRALEETIKQIRKTLDHDGKDKEKEDETTLYRNLREQMIMARLFLPFPGVTPRRTNSMERLPPLMESENSSQNTRQTREGNTGTELFPESMISPASDMTQAQENPRPTIRRIQARSVESIVAEQERTQETTQERLSARLQALRRPNPQRSVLLRARSRIQAQESYSPAVQSQVQEQTRTSQSITSQATGRTQTEERPGEHKDDKKIQTAKFCN